MHTRTIAPSRIAFVSLLAACAGAAHAGPTIVNEWLLADTGVWSDPARWSLGVAPGIGGGVGQDARIAATGTPYIVTLNTVAAINNFSLASSDATLQITGGGALELAGIATIGDLNDPSVGGLLVLNNGAIRGGTWSVLGAGALRVRGNQPSRIDDATILGDVGIETGGFLRVANASIDRVRMLGNSSVLEFEDSAPLHGAISFEGDGAALRIVRTTSPDGLIHLASDAVVETSSDFAGRGFVGTPVYTTETIVNDGRITATSGNISLGASTITNNGVMQALNASILTTSASFVNTATVELQNAVFTVGSNDPLSSLGVHNTGAITATDSTLNMGNGLTNTGTIDALRSTVFVDASRINSTGRFDLVDSTLRVGGEFTLTDLGAITRTNSTIAVAGTLHNDNQTLDLGALPDRLALDGGIIRGGSIVASGDAALSVSSNVNNALDAVNYSGRLALDQEDAFLRVRNGSNITGRIDMTGRYPELRFDASTTLDNVHINVDATQSYIAADIPGQTLTIGPNAVIDGNGLVNASRQSSSPYAPFETIINEGTMNVRAPLYWQLQSTRHLVNRGVITVDPGAELIISTGLDLAHGQLNIAPDGELSVIQSGPADPLGPSFFNGGIVNQGVIAIGADIDLQGQAITLRPEHGDIRFGNDRGFGPTIVAENGAIHVGQGSSLALDDGSVILRDLTLTGGVTINQGVQATLTDVIADLVTVRNATVNVTNSEVAETRFDGGTITATDLRDLGNVLLPAFSGGTLRLSAQGGGIADANEFTFASGSRLTVESPFTVALLNRTDWNLTRGARLTLNSGSIVNEADITVAQGAELHVTGLRSFTNPGSITLNGGHLIISNPFEFSELLDDRNNLSTGRVVLDRDIDLAGATLLLRSENGQWALGERKMLSNGVVDNLEGQPFLLLGDLTSFNTQTTLERVDVKGDIVARSTVRIGQDVTYRTLTIEREVIFAQDAAINGMLVQQDNRSVEVRFETSAGGAARIAETGGITATGDSSRPVSIYGAPGASVLENDGDILVKREGRLDSYNVSRLNNYGSIDIETDADVYLQGLNLLNFGEMRISSRADVGMSGDFDLFDTSSVVFELAQPSFGDGLFVQGDTRLDGSLEIVVTEDTSITLGDRWNLLNTNSVFGAFDSVVFETLDDPDLRLALLISDFPTNPNLEVVVRHIADVNADMAVDMDDLNLVLNGYGDSGSLLTGDANTDGLVDFHDLNIVLANFGQTFSPASVPAPGSVVALALAGLGASRRRRLPRRRRSVLSES
jgi:hypothetical protein